MNCNAFGGDKTSIERKAILQIMIMESQERTEEFYKTFICPMISNKIKNKASEFKSNKLLIEWILKEFKELIQYDEIKNALKIGYEQHKLNPTK